MMQWPVWSMVASTAPWPHAPTHQLSSAGTYLVTAGTYKKFHYFRRRNALDALQQQLLAVTQEFGWKVEAWAIFSNHYHFVAHSPEDAKDAAQLTKLLNHLHRRTAIWINQGDQTQNRKIWHNFWDTRLSFQTSYFARLNYVHQNPVKHGLVAVANQYPWCSARWLESTASLAAVQAIYRFKTERVTVQDHFAPVVDD